MCRPCIMYPHTLTLTAAVLSLFRSLCLWLSPAKEVAGGIKVSFSWSKVNQFLFFFWKVCYEDNSKNLFYCPPCLYSCCSSLLLLYKGTLDTMKRIMGLKYAGRTRTNYSRKQAYAFAPRWKQTSIFYVKFNVVEIVFSLLFQLYRRYRK